MHQTATPPEIINNLENNYRHHLRENRIHWNYKKLVRLLPIGGDNRMVIMMIVPQGLTRLIFDAYHASGIGRHFGINKTLLVLRIRFLRPKMRKIIIKWVKTCADCILMKHLVTVSQRLLQSWPLLTPFAVIFMDL